MTLKSSIFCDLSTSTLYLEMDPTHIIQVSGQILPLQWVFQWTSYANSLFGTFFLNILLNYFLKIGLLVPNIRYLYFLCSPVKQPFIFAFLNEYIGSSRDKKFNLFANAVK